MAAGQDFCAMVPAGNAAWSTELGLPPQPSLSSGGLERINTPLLHPASLRERGIAESQRGDELFVSGRVLEALDKFIEALTLAPDHPHAHYMLGLCNWKASRLHLVEHHLQQAARLDPNHLNAHQLLVDWYMQHKNLAGAMHHSARALALAPADPQILINRACVLDLAGQPLAAWELVRSLVEQNCPSARLGELYVNLADSVGHEREALVFIEGLLATDTPAAPERRALHFGAARLLDRMARYDEAFAHAGAAHRVIPRPYDRRRVEMDVQRSIAYSTPQKLHDLPRASHHNRRPVFIVGMPRSGTSLLEQILASHPQVHGGGELPTLGPIAADAIAMDRECNGRFPECLDSISQRMCDRMASNYLSQLDALNSSATYVTDKMPLNFIFMGLISMLFPECHVIHCVRDPMDTCLSCYMTGFTAGFEFASDLTDLGHFYSGYSRYMEHWRVGLNFPMLTVRYEDVVQDLMGQVRRLLEFLDLPWDARCLNFHQSRRTVMTASRYQVRRPLYTSSVGRWKHYERHLAPLKTAVGEQ
jgi:Flp pilus assembly protein TadD